MAGVLPVMVTAVHILDVDPEMSTSGTSLATGMAQVGMVTGTGSGMKQSTRTRTRKTRTQTRGSTGCPRVVRIDRTMPAEACREGLTPSKHEICSLIEVFKCIWCLTKAWEYL